MILIALPHRPWETDRAGCWLAQFVVAEEIRIFAYLSTQPHHTLLIWQTDNNMIYSRIILSVDMEWDF